MMTPITIEASIKGSEATLDLVVHTSRPENRWRIEQASIDQVDLIDAQGVSEADANEWIEANHQRIERELART